MPFFEPKITKREHDEIVAAKDAEVTLLRDQLETEIAENAAFKSKMRVLHASHAGLVDEVRLLRARLAPFERRQRGEGGKYVSFRPTVRAGDMGEVANA